MPLRHRHFVYLPFVLLLLGTLLGGQLNRVDARGVVVDMSTGDPVADVPISFGIRQTVSDAQGRYELLNLPRGARVTARPRFSYSAQTVDAEATRIELPPVTLNLQVNQKGTGDPTAAPSPIPAVGVKKPQVRQGDKVLGSGTDTGSVVVVPYPEVGSKMLVCADGYTSLEIEARGTLRTIELELGGTGCPPLPSPSPTASPSWLPSASPIGSPSGSPGGSPSPSGTTPAGSPSPSSSPTATP